MDSLIKGVMTSKSYSQLKISTADVVQKSSTKGSPFKKAASFTSPSKSPQKENSPLKKMGSLRKQSRLAEQENSQISPLKVFGKG